MTLLYSYSLKFPSAMETDVNENTIVIHGLSSFERERYDD